MSKSLLPYGTKRKVWQIWNISFWTWYATGLKYGYKIRRKKEKKEDGKKKRKRVKGEKKEKEKREEGGTRDKEEREEKHDAEPAWFGVSRPRRSRLAQFTPFFLSSIRNPTPFSSSFLALEFYLSIVSIIITIIIIITTCKTTTIATITATIIATTIAITFRHHYHYRHDYVILAVYREPWMYSGCII